MSKSLRLLLQSKPEVVAWRPVPFELADLLLSLPPTLRNISLVDATALSWYFRTIPLLSSFTTARVSSRMSEIGASIADWLTSSFKVPCMSFWEACLVDSRIMPVGVKPSTLNASLKACVTRRFVQLLTTLFGETAIGVITAHHKPSRTRERAAAWIVPVLSSLFHDSWMSSGEYVDVRTDLKVFVGGSRAEVSL